MVDLSLEYEVVISPYSQDINILFLLLVLYNIDLSMNSDIVRNA